MAFKTTGRRQTSFENPEALFHDLRNRSVQGLLAQQADMLRAYASVSQEADVALQLPTGSGKTLVGLLIAEWRRRRFNERAVFFCPTKQLVNQVVEQSGSYGIRATAFTGPQREYAPDAKGDYQSGDVVAVSTYSSLFNTNPFFADAGMVVFDDAHAAESYVAKFWSVSIERAANPQTFGVVTEFLRTHLEPADYGRMAGPSAAAWDRGWVDLLPGPVLAACAGDLVSLLNEHLGESPQRFSWTVVRDRLDACQVFLSAREILIRPLLPPTEYFEPFTGPRQRVYMSATLGAAGELERIWGRRKIQRLPVPAGWDKQGIGRRLFFFPERSLDQEASHRLVLTMIGDVSRALVLAPTTKTVDAIADDIERSLDREVFRALDLEEGKAPFTTSPRAVALLANRYDGLDLAGEECRLLVVYGLPRAMNLQETFVTTRLGADIFLTDRVLTRIAQAVGRCTRSATDYSAVVLMGEELTSFLLRSERRSLFHPEMQGELEFGIEQSRDVHARDFIENLRLFLSRGEAWDAAELEILAQRDNVAQQSLPAATQLAGVVSREVQFQSALWQGAFSLALQEAKAVLAGLGGDDLRGYRALWNYLAGCAAERSGDGQQAREFFGRAAKTAPSLRWLPKLASLRAQAGAPEPQEPDDLVPAQLLVLEQQLARLGTAHSGKLETKIKAIEDNLAQDGATPFEAGLVELGGLLGFEAKNSEVDAAPDPWWLVDDRFCVVFEAHTNKTAGANAILGAQKVRQAKSHPDWIRSNANVRIDAEVLAVIVTPCLALGEGAVPHVDGVFYWEIGEFRTWARQALGVIREVWGWFRQPGELDWRARAAERLRERELDAHGIGGRIRSSPLSSLVNK